MGHTTHTQMITQSTRSSKVNISPSRCILALLLNPKHKSSHFHTQIKSFFCCVTYKCFETILRRNAARLLKIRHVPKKKSPQTLPAVSEKIGDSFLQLKLSPFSFPAILTRDSERFVLGLHARTTKKGCFSRIFFGEKQNRVFFLRAITFFLCFCFLVSAYYFESTPFLSPCKFSYRNSQN